MTNPTDEHTTADRPMTRRQFHAAAAAALLGAVGVGATRGGSPAVAETATATAAKKTSKSRKATKRTIDRTAVAAAAFMKTLSAAQRETLVHDYKDETKSTSWSNFPITFVQRAGLNLHDLTTKQQAAALRVLAALLSDAGYETVTGIMEGDVFLHEKSSSTEQSLGQYYIAFFGKPSKTGAWELQFGGHHLGINATLNGAKKAITFAPTHLGSQPAVYTDDAGHSVQPLAGMYTSAFRFFDSLTTKQRTALYQGASVSAQVCAPGGTCSFPTGGGLAGADLSAKQRKLLLKVIANWVALSDAKTSARELGRIEKKLDRTYVKWSGATTYDMTKGDGIYYEISGPNCFIEFACQNGSAGADVSGVTTAGWGHIHTIYRDPTNDYANSVAQQAASGPGGMGGPPTAG